MRCTALSEFESEPLTLRRRGLKLRRTWAALAKKHIKVWKCRSTHVVNVSQVSDKLEAGIAMGCWCPIPEGKVRPSDHRKKRGKMVNSRGSKLSRLRRRRQSASNSLWPLPAEMKHLLIFFISRAVNDARTKLEHQGCGVWPIYEWHIRQNAGIVQCLERHNAHPTAYLGVCNPFFYWSVRVLAVEVSHTVHSGGCLSTWYPPSLLHRRIRPARLSHRSVRVEATSSVVLNLSSYL